VSWCRAREAPARSASWSLLFPDPFHC
jgi:hypothetical protein